jgi:hypothetical protein
LRRKGSLFFNPQSGIFLSKGGPLSINAVPIANLAIGTAFILRGPLFQILRKMLCKKIKRGNQKRMKNEDKDVHLLPSFADWWAVADGLLLLHFFYFLDTTNRKIWNLKSGIFKLCSQNFSAFAHRRANYRGL